MKETVGRRHRTGRTWLWALAFTVGLAGAARGEPDKPVPNAGTLTAVGRDGNPLGPCPLRHTDVSVRISGFVARVRVVQRFDNPFPEPIEAVYTFPLSDRGAVDAMRMRAGERVILGEIKRREEARRIYEEARASGRMAGLLDQERPNIFTQSIANLMPGTAVDVEIEYVEPLKYEDGAFELSFPSVVGPRFIPGSPTGSTGTGWSPDTDRVPDASRLTPPVAPPDTRAGHDLSIEVDVDAGLPLAEIAAPLHAIDVERPNPSHARVRLKQQTEIPNRDFVLRYTVAGDGVRSGFLAHREPGQDGYLSLFLVPPPRVTAAEASPKEMIFVIDRSGSQSGLPLLKAKETMLWILDHMNPNDTFQIVDFGSTANVLFHRPQPASLQMRRQARAYIDELEANGGTMMAEAVQRVCAMPADAHRLRIVTFMTDGYIGNDFEVVGLVRKLRGTSRWFPFGTGNSVNRSLLESMAREGGGEVDYVLLSDPGETVARRFYERIASPVLTDVRVEIGGGDAHDTFPTELVDLWAQKPLVLHARYRTAGPARVVLKGYRAGQPFEQVIDIRLPEAQAAPGIASMWARAKVDALMRQDWQGLQTESFRSDLQEAVVEVALAHRLMTQFTSFVAVEEKVVNEGGRMRTVTVPVEMPQGVRHEGVFGEAVSGPVAKAGAGASVSGVAAPLVASREMRADRQSFAPANEAVASHKGKREEGKLQDADASSRLAPELRADRLGKPGSPLTVKDGSVRVKVVLRGCADAIRKRLVAAGLRIDSLTEEAAIGWIAVDRLERLASLACIERIEPAPAS